MRVLGCALKIRFRRPWPAPPYPSVEAPRKWWSLVAACGLTGRASEEAWNRLFAEVKELLIFAPIDLAELEAGRLHIASDSAEPNRLFGQLWRAVKASGDVKYFSGRGNPPIFVRRRWGAFQLAGAVAADSA